MGAEPRGGEHIHRASSSVQAQAQGANEEAATARLDPARVGSQNRSRTRVGRNQRQSSISGGKPRRSSENRRELLDDRR